MDVKTIKTEIDQLLEILNEQWSIIHQHQGHIPQIELDLFQDTIKDLYEVLLNLQRKNDEIVPLTSPAVPVADDKAREIPAVETPAKPVPLPVSDITASQQPEVKVVNEVPQVTYREPETAAEFSFRPPKPEPDLFSAGNETIADKLKEDKITLNEKLLQDTNKNTVGTRLNLNPIKDLKSSIGINEKFQFINELFNGSMQDYTQGILDLNQFSNYEEALRLIDVLKFKYNWDINSDAYHKIMDFVRRRYI